MSAWYGGQGRRAYVLGVVVADEAEVGLVLLVHVVPAVHVDVQDVCATDGQLRSVRFVVKLAKRLP